MSGDITTISSEDAMLIELLINLAKLGAISLSHFWTFNSTPLTERSILLPVSQSLYYSFVVGFEIWAYKYSNFIIIF